MNANKLTCRDAKQSDQRKEEHKMLGKRFTILLVVSGLVLALLSSACRPLQADEGLGLRASEGGQIVAGDGITSVSIPPGAMPHDTFVWAEPLVLDGLPETDGVRLLGGASFGPDGLQFDQLVTVTIALAKSLTPGTILDLFYYREAEDVYELMAQPATVSEDGTYASAQVDHFSSYLVGDNDNKDKDDKLKPKKDAEGNIIPNQFTLELEEGEKVSVKDKKKLVNVINGPNSDNAIVATAKVTNGGKKGERDVTDTITVYGNKTGKATIEMEIETWALALMGGFAWVKSGVTIDVTVVPPPSPILGIIGAMLDVIPIPKQGDGKQGGGKQGVVAPPSTHTSVPYFGPPTGDDPTGDPPIEEEPDNDGGGGKQDGGALPDKQCPEGYHCGPGCPVCDPPAGEEPDNEGGGGKQDSGALHNKQCPEGYHCEPGCPVCDPPADEEPTGDQHAGNKPADDNSGGADDSGNCDGFKRSYVHTRLFPDKASAENYANQVMSIRGPDFHYHADVIGLFDSDWAVNVFRCVRQ